MFEATIWPTLLSWLDMFTNPQKRIFWVYILSAFVIGYFYLYYINKSFSQSFKQFFNKQNWWSSSAKADYLVLLVNNLLMGLIASKLLTKSIISYAVFYFLSDLIPSSSILFGLLTNWQVALLFTLCLFILDDFTKYWVHRWLHTVKFLWPYHRVHHSATKLNFFTVFRTHPVEAILFSLRNAFTQGIVVGIFFFLFGDQMSLMMVLGANLFSFAFNLLGSNLRHSPVALPYPKFLERYFISPAQHHIHHSLAPEHYNKNYGVVFACWDRWFGSFHHSEASKELVLGVSDNKGEKEHHLQTLYLTPFIQSSKKLSNQCKNIIPSKSISK